MRLYLKSGQIVDIDEVVETIDYVEYNYRDRGELIYV